MESVRGWQWGCRPRYCPAKAGSMMGRTLFRLERSGQNVIWAAGLWSGSIRVQAQPSTPPPACIGGADRVPLVPHRLTVPAVRAAMLRLHRGERYVLGPGVVMRAAQGAPAIGRVGAGRSAVL